LKKRNLITLLATAISILVLLITGCTTQTETPSASTPTAMPAASTSAPATITSTPQVVTKPEVFQALNPRGIEPAVKCSALSPRLSTLDGKTIAVSIAEADPVITQPLSDRLKKDNPKTTWNGEWVQTFGPSAPTEAMLKADGVVIGIGW
jgi:hypothetical protein